MTSTQSTINNSFVNEKKLRTTTISNFWWNEDRNQSSVVEEIKSPAMYVVDNNFNVGKNAVSTVFIKNMICSRCKMMVRSILEKMGLECIRLELGKAEVKGVLTGYKVEQLNNALLNIGLELMTDKRVILVDKIKKEIIEMIYQSDELPVAKNSVYLSEKLNYNYTYLSNIFSEVEGIGIEQFIIKQKVKRVKELLIYDQLTIAQIAWQLNYSSVAHLSNQFRKITGVAPSHFKTKIKKLVQLKKCNA